MSKDKQVVSDDQEQFWRMVLESRRESGLTVAGFCRQEGLSAAAYHYWRKKLEPAGSSKEGSKGNGVPADPARSKNVTRRQKTGVPLPTVAPGGVPAGSFIEPKAAASFVEVSLPAKRAAGLELVLSSGHVLRIPVGVDGEAVRQVLVVLQQVGLC